MRCLRIRDSWVQIMTVLLMRMVSLGRYFPDISVFIFQKAKAQRVRPRYPEPCLASLGFATSTETWGK